VRAYRHERQVNWLLAMEEAFRHWRGVPAQVLFGNARALVKEHDPARQLLVYRCAEAFGYNERLDAFARYWGFIPKAPRPPQGLCKRAKGGDGAELESAMRADHHHTPVTIQPAGGLRRRRRSPGCGGARRAGRERWTGWR